MALSPNMIRWVTREVVRAQQWLRDPDTTPSQRTVAERVLATWAVR